MSNPLTADDLHALSERFPEAILETIDRLSETTLYVDPHHIIDVCRFLKEDPRFDFKMLTDLCGVDLGIDMEPRFEVVYLLTSLSRRCRVRLKVRLPGDDPSIQTATTVWKTADWHERETFDMFGIDFAGHPDLRRILMPEEFQWHPLRKDFPVRGYDDF